MTVFYDSGQVVLHQGDAREVLRGLEAESVDAVVTDPPYGLEFMGKDWDAPWRRQDGVGGTSGGFGSFVLADGADRLPRPSYLGGTNPTCRNCGGSKRGSEERQRKGRKHCACGRPDFPNVAAIRGQSFEGWTREWATEVLRVAKPGAHLVAFGGARTYHRLTCAIEDAGWEIRDSLMWLFGSGFPKSLNVQQAINKAARGHPQGVADPGSPNHGKFKGGVSDLSPTGRGFGAGAGAFMSEQGEGRGDDDGPWQGWGTALKPGYEPIVLARKPLRGTVAANVESYGVGGLNIDGCRIEGTKPHRETVKVQENDWAGDGPWKSSGVGSGESSEGRWPANVLLDEAAAAMLDAEVGELGRVHTPYVRGSTDERGRSQVPGHRAGEWNMGCDSGGPSRFYYTAKASRSEREAFLGELPAVRRSDGRAKDIENPRLRTNARRNHHPTVKPVDLMRWLVRLVTPPGGLVLDPFLGSGTTAIAATAEGFRCVGIDLDAEYLEMAKRRCGQLGMVAP